MGEPNGESRRMERFLLCQVQAVTAMGSILIVDDEKHIRETLAMYVQSLGHTVETAMDAETALEAVERRDFDLVVSDVRMEGLGGLGLLRQLRERQRTTAVVLMTAYPTAPQAVEAMRLGACEYLMKPFSPDDVRLLINHVLDARTLPREVARSCRPGRKRAGFVLLFAGSL
jgi:two-component system response regulator PilR (NtrC family)